MARHFAAGQRQHKLLLCSGRTKGRQPGLGKSHVDTQAVTPVEAVRKYKTTFGECRLECDLADFTCELNRIFGDLAAHVPDGPPGFPEFVFHAGVLPLPPTALSSDRIVIRKRMTDYNGWYRADALWMSLSPRKCRELGVFLLACAFHGPSESTTFTISHPDSDIRRIII